MARIKMIAFDLDGVLFKAKEIHYVALRDALKEVVGFEHTLDQHMRLDGLSTRVKLELLAKGECPALNDEDTKELVHKAKQRNTEDLIIKTVVADNRLCEVLAEIKSKYALKFCVVSNAIYSSVENIISQLGLLSLMDFIVSNQSVCHNKPHAEPYIVALVSGGVFPWECIVFEDKELGKQSAMGAGCHCFMVKGPDDLTVDFIEEKLLECETV